MIIIKPFKHTECENLYKSATKLASTTGKRFYMSTVYIGKFDIILMGGLVGLLIS
jgi:hypothetical protein